MNIFFTKYVRAFNKPIWSMELIYVGDGVFALYIRQVDVKFYAIRTIFNFYGNAGRYYSIHSFQNTNVVIGDITHNEFKSWWNRIVPNEYKIIS